MQILATIMNRNDLVPETRSEMLVLLRPNGTALGGTEMPVTWLERRLEEPLVPASVATACALLCAEAITGAHRRVNAEIGGEMRTVLLVLVDALPLRRSLIRVTDMLMQTLGLFMTTAHTSAVELHVHRDDDLPVAMYGDSEKLTWVFATLVGNALRMIQSHRRDEGGRIDIEAHFDREQKAFVFVISDTGPGMPESISQWLFQRNPTTGKAAGLALLMVHDVIAAHKGTIDVTSTLGKGTRFTIRIPKVQAPA